MTVATFDPAARAPMPSGFDSFVLTPADPDIDPRSLPVGPIFAVTDGAALGDGRFLIGSLPYGTYQVGPGTNDGGPPFHAPGYDPLPAASGPAASSSRVTIDAADPNAVIAFYRLGQGVG